MGIDLLLLQNDKGGDLESVIASQKKRFASEELVTEVLDMYKGWTKSEFGFPMNPNKCCVWARYSYQL